MSKRSKLKINLILQSFYQVLIVLTPLLTSPYVSRVLGADKLGVYSYTYSIVNYFTIFANLGTQNYGSRSIAACGTDREKKSKVFSEIYCMQFFASVIAITGYVVYLLIFNESDSLISAIQTIYIFVSLFTLNWFFFGIEEFRMTVFRNTLIKILTIIGIFAFVKSENDLQIYIIILAGGELFGQIIMLPTLRKYVDWSKPSLRGVIKHIKPNFILFLPAIAYSLNHVLDKTMIGIFSTYTQNGYYYNVEKIVNIPKGLITGIGIVMMPRMSMNVAHGEKKTNEIYLRKFIYVVSFLSCALAFGMSAVAADFIPWFFGDGYEGCISLMEAMAFALIFMSLSDTVRMQFLIPNKKDSVYAIALFVSAAFNVTLNYLLIPILGALGAVVGTLTAEFVAFVIQFTVTARNMRIVSDLVKSISFLIAGLIMLLVVKFIANLFMGYPALVKLIAEILAGGFTYVIMTIMFMKKLYPKILRDVYYILQIKK